MEFFIEKVKPNTCLWKISDVSYRDTRKKDLVWERIARECEMANGKEAKSHWKKLRDSHREALRRRKTSTGQAAQNSRPWKYEALMEFLLTQKENNETFYNYSNPQDTCHEHDTQNSPDINRNYDVTELPALPSDLPLSTSSLLQSEQKNNKRIHITETLQLREKHSEQTRRERDEERIRNIDSNRPRDALTDLFSSLCQKTRDLPKYLQLRVQREIFDSVTRAEEEALSHDSANSR